MNTLAAGSDVKISKCLLVCRVPLEISPRATKSPLKHSSTMARSSQNVNRELVSHLLCGSLIWLKLVVLIILVEVPIDASKYLPTISNPPHPDSPRVIPLSALDKYQEGADLRLFCSATAPATGGRLQFEWRKDHELIRSPSSIADGINVNNNNNINYQQQRRQRLQLSQLDDSSSVLRISQLEAEDSGNYTCVARNQHGFDSAGIRVNVIVRIKWLKEPPPEVEVRAGQAVQLECDAAGQPAPLISWTSLKDRQTVNSKLLRFDRAQIDQSGLYECRASSAAQGEQLRKLVRLVIRGK